MNIESIRLKNFKRYEPFERELRDAALIQRRFGKYELQGF